MDDTSEPMTPALITEIVSRISKAKSIKELDTEPVRDQIWQVAMIMNDYNQEKIQEPEASEIPLAFLKGQPASALFVLIEFRSGKPLKNQSQQAPPTASPASAATPSATAAAAQPSAKKPVDFEKQSPFAMVYRRFMVAFRYSMFRREDVCRTYIVEGGVGASLRELSAEELLLHMHKAPHECLSASTLSLHLSLIYNAAVNSGPALRAQLSEELEKNGYFPIIKKLSLSQYAY